MERDITNCFQNLRKKEQIQNKEGMEKTRSERELKRQEWSVNYERGSASNSNSPGGGGGGKKWFVDEFKGLKF